MWTSNPTYTVIYNGNGATGGTAPADTANYQQGQTVTVMGNTGNLVKAGYTLSSWNTAANGSGTSYSIGSTFSMGLANVTLYAQWVLIPAYSVTYSGNSPTGGTAPSDPNSYTNGQSVTVSGNTGNLVKTGFSFAGWNTAAGGTGTSYAAGQQFTMGGAAVTLFAQWSLVPTYNVTYSGNGSSGGSVPQDGNAYTNGQTITVLGNTGNLAKTGYAFTSWNTLSSGAGTSYQPGSTFHMGTGAVALYAIWAATYSVTYSGNGSSGGAVPIDGNAYTNGQTVTVLGNTGNLVDTGKTFTGWNTLAGGTGTTYSQGATFTMGPANVGLYALWTANPTYTVTYNPNGATGGNVPVDSTQYQAGQNVTVQGNTGALARSGFALASWSNTTGNSYTAGQTFVMGSANVNLYAVWVATYTVTYNGNGNTGGTAPADNNSYTNGQTVTVLGNTGALVRTGYIFSAWSNISGTKYTSSQTFVMGAANATLSACWTAVYTVTYSGNGSTGGTVPADNNNYTNNQTATVLGNTGNLVQTGYIFLKWNTAANGSGISYVAGNTFAINSANVTLYAVWNPLYTVTYNGNGNTGGTAPSDNNNYTNGQVVTVLSNSGVLVKTGSTFTGWTNTAGTFYAQGSSFGMGTASVTLYADWTSITTYSVTYVGNGNTGGTVPLDGNAYTNGQTVTVLGNTGNLVLFGYTLTGWNTATNGSGISYSIGGTFKMGTANVILYAVWSEFINEFQTSSNAAGYASDNFTINTYSTLYWTNAANGSDPTVTITPGTTYQSITGIGGAFTMASASVVLGSGLSQGAITGIADMLFGTNGNDYTIARTHIGSCDYSLYSYCYDNTVGDTGLNNFTIATDMLYLVPWISDCMLAQTASGEPNNIFLFACPWEPCFWMTTAGTFNAYNNWLNTSDYQYYANYLVKYLQAYKAIGITVNMIGIQNEPCYGFGYESCDFLPAEEANFIVNNLGPAISSAGLGTKINVFDNNWGTSSYEETNNQPISWLQEMFGDNAASQNYVYGAGVHWYSYQGSSGEDSDPNIQNSHNSYPNVKIFSTEACSLNQAPHIGDWNLAELYAHDIIHDFDNGAAGWADWNMVLNSEGGPNHANPVNLNGAFIEVNQSTLAIITNPGYYYMQHYSKYIRPGASEISATTGTGNLYVMGALNTNNTVAVVVLNWNGSAQAYNMQYGSKYLVLNAPAHTLTTFTFQK